MRIIRFKIKNFRKFREREFQFSDGINIFYGPNETGKTTILSALLRILFTDAGTKSKNLLGEISSWNADSLPDLELDFRLNEGEYKLVRNFETKEQFISSISNKGRNRIKGASEIRDFISQGIGIANEDIFTLTALIAQNDIARIGVQKPKEKAAVNLRDGIQESLTGTGNISVEGILEKLRKVITDLERGWHNPARNNGIIKSLEIEQKDLTSRIEEIKPQVNKIGKLIQQNKDADKEFGNLDKEIINLESLISNNQKRREAEKRVKELQNLIIEKESLIQEIERIKKNISEYEHELQAFAENKDFDEMLERIKTINILKDEKFQKIEIITKQIENIRVNLQKRRKIFQIIILSAIPVLAFMAYQFFKISNSILIFPAAIIFFILAYLPARGIFLQKNLLQFNEKERTGNDEKLSVEKLEKEKALLLHSFGVPSENELNEMREKVLRIKSSRERAEASLDALTKGETLAEIKQRQAALLSEKKDLEINELTDEIKASVIDPEEEYGRMTELQELKRKRDNIKEFRMKTKLQTENKKFSYDDLVRLEEKMARVNQDLEYYKQKTKTLRLVGQFLNEARGEVVSSSSSVIAQYMEKYLPILTNNRYHKVRVSTEMEFQIFSDEKKDWIVPDAALSRGTIDQIYFLARMAILQIISKGKKTPVILDDPFVTFDAQRREGVRQVLNDLSKERQIILLTCHEDFNSWGNLITVK